MISNLAVVAAVNDEQVLEENLLKSPMIAQGKIPTYLEKGQSCAGAAYNAGLSSAGDAHVIFAHQDVYFPAGWDDQLRQAIGTLEKSQTPWAILGVWGIQQNSQLAGRVWCTASKCEYVGHSGLREIVSVDEIVIVLKRDSGMRFDENLPGFHLYATDIIRNAMSRGLKAFVFDGPVIHNSRIAMTLDSHYCAAYRYMQRKWAAELPLPTCVLPVTRFGWPLRKKLVKIRLNLMRRPFVSHPRLADPSQQARALGYEPGPKDEAPLAGSDRTP